MNAIVVLEEWKMSPIQNIAGKLEHRRKEMRLSCHRLAKLCGLSDRTVQRVLKGETDAGISTLCAIGDVLGARIGIIHTENPKRLLKKKALRKARELVDAAQGNASLEGMAASKNFVKKEIEKTARGLLSGPKIRLWG